MTKHPDIHIIVDSMEIQPWTFKDMPLDSKYGGGVWDVPTTVSRLPVRQGDYSLRGWIGQVSVERKSPQDCVQTILDFKDRRKNFKQELETLADMQCKAVIIEGGIPDVLAAVEARGRHSVAHLRKIVLRSILSWGQKYHVPWIPAGSRRGAEICCLRLFELFLKDGGL